MELEMFAKNDKNNVEKIVKYQGYCKKLEANLSKAQQDALSEF